MPKGLRKKILDVISDKYPQFKGLVLRKRPEVLFNEAARAFLNKNVILALKLIVKMVVSSKGYLGWPIRTFVRTALRMKY